MTQSPEEVVGVPGMPEQDSWISATFPEIGELRKLLCTISSEAKADQNPQALAVLKSAQSVGREGTRLAERRLKGDILRPITLAGVHLICDLDEEETQRRTLEENLQRALPGTLLEPFGEVLGAEILDNARFYQALLGSGRQLSQKSKTLLDSQGKIQFRAASELADITGHDLDPSQTPDRIIWATALLIAADHDKEQSIPEGLLEFLKKGHYDQFIAGTLLERHFASRDIQGPSNQTTGLPNLVALAEGLIKNNKPTEITRRLTELLSAWPPDARRELAMERGRLADHLVLSIEKLRINQQKYGFNLPTVQREEIFGSAVLEVNRILARRSGHPIGAQVLMQETKRRRLAPSGNGGSVNATSDRRDGSVEAVKQEPRYRLGWLDVNTGNRYPQESEEFQEKITGYVKDHTRGPELRRDIDTILTSMAFFDFSHGPINGVEKYASPVKVNGVAMGVFGLKPFQGSNLSTKTKEANKIRVLFTLEEDILYIIGISRRDKVDRLERLLGIASSAKM